MAHDHDAPRNIIPQKPPPPPPPKRERAPDEPLDPSDPPTAPPSRPTAPPSQRPTLPRVEQPAGHGSRKHPPRRSFPPPPPDVEIIDRAARVSRDSEPLMLIDLGGDRRGARSAAGVTTSVYRYR